jgi:hypothetical protein
MTLLYVLLAIVIIQQALDVWTTKVALGTGRAREANGPLRRLMDKIGIMPTLLGTKALFGALVALTVQDTVVWYVVLGLIIALYTWVLFNNFRVLKKIGAL